MCYIELKNEKYETLEDLKRLLHYILRLDKTAEDSQRANTITNTLAGCHPAMIPNEYLCDPSAVYNLMLFEVRRRHKGIPQFAKHRIVSFAATDCILPQDVVSMRRTVILQPMEFMRIDLMYIFILQFVQYRFKHRICFIFNGKLNGKCLRW